MVCKNCGANIPEGTKFCTSCGATVEAEVGFQDAAVVQAPAKKSNKKLIAIIAGVVAVIIAFICIFGGGSYKSTIKKYYSAIENGDGSKLQACYPFYVKAAKADGDSASDIKDEYKDRAESLHDLYAERYGDDFKIKYEIKDADKVDKDDLEDFEKELNEAIEEEDINMGKVSISQGYEVEVEGTIKGSEDEDEFEDTFYMLKINGKWNIIYVR